MLIASTRLSGRASLKCLMIAGLSLCAASRLAAFPVNLFSTGICGGNNGACAPGTLLTSPSQFDNNYRIISRSDAGVTGNNSTQTTPPISGWVAQNSTSDWITPVPGGGFADNATFTIQTSFSLAGFVANTFVLNLNVAADNLVAVRINGGATNVFTPACNSGPPAAQPYCYEQFYSASINNAAVVTANGAGWNAGTNTIEFLLTNKDAGTASALRVEISGNATLVPAPSPTGLRVELSSVTSTTPPTLFNTGVCAGNNVGCSPGLLTSAPSQFDNNYRLISRSDAGTTGNNSTQTTPPVLDWLGPNSTSGWITPVPGGNFGAHTFTFQTSFSLAGLVANTLVLTVNVAADNLVGVRINGGATNVFTPTCNSAPPLAPPYCRQQFYTMSIDNAALAAVNGFGWNAGTNTIEFLLSNILESPPDPPLSSSTGATIDYYQVAYQSNLQTGESYVNITNAGTRNGFDPDGGICANVYVFDPSEEMVACCSCYVSPDGLRSLASQDLISNSLTASKPNGIVVKLLASQPTGSAGATCDPTAPNGSTLESGMRAWTTALHLNTTSSAYQLSENAFRNAVLSPSELQKLTTFCGFIKANGSNFGQCKACRVGGSLGGAIH